MNVFVYRIESSIYLFMNIDYQMLHLRIEISQDRIVICIFALQIKSSIHYHLLENQSLIHPLFIHHWETGPIISNRSHHPKRKRRCIKVRTGWFSPMLLQQFSRHQQKDVEASKNDSAVAQGKERRRLIRTTANHHQQNNHISKLHRQKRKGKKSQSKRQKRFPLLIQRMRFLN